MIRNGPPSPYKITAWHWYSAVVANFTTYALICLVMETLTGPSFCTTALQVTVAPKKTRVAADPARGAAGSTTSAASMRFVRKRIRESIWPNRRLP